MHRSIEECVQDLHQKGYKIFVADIDDTAPNLSSSSPADNATAVAINSNIVLTFSEAVDVENGSILIKKTSDNSTFESIFGAILARC